MDATLAALAQSWPRTPGLTLVLLACGVVYVRGWLVLRRKVSWRFGRAQLAAFLTGLVALQIALGSPIEPFSALLLEVHMVQHLTLMMAAPALVWLGSPVLPILHGLPRTFVRQGLGPFLRWSALRGLVRGLVHPFCAWPLFVGATWLWHVPAVYDAALRSPALHRLEHSCFLLTALLFWWPVVRPFPARVRWSRWVLLPYLFAADLQNTALAALLTFSDRVVYGHYAALPGLWGVSPLGDQAIAGVLMWVPGQLFYLVPIVAIGARLVFGDQLVENRRQGVVQGNAKSQPSAPAVRRFNVLDIPLVGRFLRWRHARWAVQIPLFVLAILVVADGLLGPQVAAMNLAGVLPWIHWRAFALFGILLAGNVFCMACPFMLPRRLARLWHTPSRPWPRWLRSKWLAVGLLAVFFWSYEALALWASPWLTAWVVLAYFAAAFAIDAFFQGASFCKYVCPVGQFQFVHSLLSPLEVAVTEPDRCASCTTHECLKGSAQTPGCELELFLPRKQGNLDCTLCLDCVHACPHENVGVYTVVPGAELVRDVWRSGIGRWSARPDIAALVLVIALGAFANAAGMAGPIVAFEERIAASLGFKTLAVVASACFAILMLALAALFAVATALAHKSLCVGWRELAAQAALALVPLGASMWLSHAAYHFVPSAGAIVPVSQRALGDLGVSALGTPDWPRSCCAADAVDWLLPFEIVLLDLGMLGSLWAAYRIALRKVDGAVANALRGFWPLALFITLLFCAGVWIVLQPMQMRGTVLAGS